MNADRMTSLRLQILVFKRTCLENALTFDYVSSIQVNNIEVHLSLTKNIIVYIGNNRFEVSGRINTYSLRIEATGSTHLSKTM